MSHCREHYFHLGPSSTLCGGEGGDGCQGEDHVMNTGYPVHNLTGQLWGLVDCITPAI